MGHNTLMLTPHPGVGTGERENTNSADEARALLADYGQWAKDDTVTSAERYEALAELVADPGCLVSADHVHDIVRVAVTGVAVGDHRNGHSGSHRPRHFEEFGHGENVRVRQSVRGGHLQTARPDTVEPGALGEACAESVVRPHDPHRTGTFEQRPELGGPANPAPRGLGKDVFGTHRCRTPGTSVSRRIPEPAPGWFGDCPDAIVLGEVGPEPPQPVPLSAVKHRIPAVRPVILDRKASNYP